MKRLVIAFDCDDVLQESAYAILDAYNLKYGTKIPHQDFYSDKLWGAASELTAAERVDEIIKSGLTAKVAPRDDVITTVKKLHEDGHELHVVTGRQDYQIEETMEFLNTFFNHIFTSVTHTNMYAQGDNLQRRIKKSDVIKKLNADLLIDDHLSHCIDVIENTDAQAIVYGDYVWNQQAELPERIRRCLTMDQVYNRVQEIANE